MMAEDSNFRSNYMEGVNRFNSARSKAFWKDMIALLRGQPAELLSFDEVKSRLRLREESYKGLQDVPLDKIAGSVGRYKEFTANFLPKSNGLKERWSRVYAVAHSMSGYPPIEVYKIGDVYFVRDGNHRVSVARQLGARTIEAHVTELPTSVNIEPGMSYADMDAAVAYASFLEESGLKRTRPHHQSMQLSEASRYHELLGHIYLHARVMEQISGQAVTTGEAAGDWYDNVYRPAVTLIRKHNMLELIHERDRTETDLYLWMVDHLREVRDQYEDYAPSRKFSHALVDYLTQKKMPIPRELLEENDASVILTRSQARRAVLEEEKRRLREQTGEAPDASGEGDV